MAGTLRRIPGCHFGATGRSGDLIGGRYQLLDWLGAGSFGRVYKARDVETGREAAVKLLHPDTRDPTTRSRFIREMALLSLLRNQPYIVQIYEHGESSEELFIAMELIEGYSLGDWLLQMKEQGRLPTLRRVIPWFDQICRAISAAHACGIIHRDIKPSNIMAARTKDREDPVKVLDFGVARCGERMNTATGEQIGTHGYMAPEQLFGQGDKLCPASDVFSLGILLVELLAPGRHQLCSGFHQIRTIAKASVLRSHLHKLRSDVPPELWKVIMKALAPYPSQRFPGAHEFRHAVEQVARDLLPDPPFSRGAQGDTPAIPPAA